jgi:hypothetical protein
LQPTIALGCLQWNPVNPPAGIFGVLEPASHTLKATLNYKKLVRSAKFRVVPDTLSSTGPAGERGQREAWERKERENYM